MGVPVMGWCAALAFVIQWVAFIPAYRQQSERFYDLTGSLTYISVTVLALTLTLPIDGRSALLALFIIVWAGRLGSFLFRRIRAEGSDARFDAIKPSASRFLVAWTLQGLWVFLTLCAALAAITSLARASLGMLDVIGAFVWAGGFGIEVVADRQKSAFRQEHPGRFIDRGLWAWSRHPNYFGEIVLWTGIALIASSTLRGWQWATWVSPVFVTLLLTRVSGIPILERRANARWNGDADYERYKARTPVLIPRRPK
jgi:steroid 5-alpha reductase family enzyme